MHLRIANGDLMDQREEEDLLWRIAKSRKDKNLQTRIVNKEEQKAKNDSKLENNFFKKLNEKNYIDQEKRKKSKEKVTPTKPKFDSNRSTIEKLQAKQKKLKVSIKKGSMFNNVPKRKSKKANDDMN